MNLTDEQKTALNVGLATWRGCVEIDDHGNGLFCKRPRPSDGELSIYPLPNYLDPLTGLSHINRLEERLTDREWSRYHNALKLRVLDDFYERGIGKPYTEHASASQRAIALARTLDLNIEGVTQ